MTTARFRRPLLAITLSVTLAGCGEPSGRPAQPATLEGLPTKLADAEPCIWNGDSGCTGRELRRHDPVLCVLRGAKVEFDAGAPAREATASAGHLKKQQFPIPILSSRGRVELPVQRIDGRRFIMSTEEPLPSSVRVLHIHVRYATGVLTPYTPTDDSQTTRGRREQFKSGVYALRVRSRRGKDCTKVAR